MNADVLLDAVDRRLLAALQVDARQTFDALGAAVGLSASATLRRVRRLEQEGMIAGYRAELVPERLGLGLTAYVNVRLEKHTPDERRSPMESFRAAVHTWPEVVECSALAGEMDYLLRILVRDMEHYARFLRATLLQHPSVQDCKTSFVLERVKVRTAVPL
ncbi:Lrp/AsnC family leucine-responsive transcriptional regulator [Inhella inkyongensis]|uniref:Lrp/AsnC family leucine-responsive transcriptional regulator n=1 Tax=Inhella inkyongensis TaxID=392593 RepID=A0A840SC43_9BURK|nr:Lrp/AsnC family transcriptional regulator [Inhella inkyongensis]MBB5206334.1 Lrp/AsnC family leucine-responsive transcriptional regulator [Inhella inkyongensis]